jgi:hypothetical protein
VIEGRIFTVRRFLLCSLVLAGCHFTAPDNLGSGGGDDGGGDDDPVDPDAAERVCDVEPSWETTAVPKRTLHVSTMAGTGTPDGSPQSPFTTLSAAMTAAKAAGPGTRILLAGGTYVIGFSISDLRGTAAEPFWIEGPATGTRAQLVGGSASIHLIRPAYVALRHLTITQTAQASVNIDDGGVGGDAHDVVIDDVTIASTTATAFQITGVTDVTIRDSMVGAANRGVMMVGVRRATIARLVTGSTPYASVALAGGSQDIEVRQSRFEDTGTGVRIGNYSDANEFRPALKASAGNFEAADVRVFDNVFGGTIMLDAITCTNCTHVLVAHNAIRAATRSVFRLEQAYAVHPQLAGAQFVRAGQVRWVNNAIETAGSPGAMSVANSAIGDMPDAASCSFSRNLWYRRSPAAAWTPTFPAALAETMGIYDKPSGYDDRGKLCSGGGAVGAGVALPEVNGTLGGTCRPAPPSIGPSERDPGC